MTSDEHCDAIITIVTDALNGYLRHHSHGVRTDVMQRALGYVVTVTFESLGDHASRIEMLDSFCSILRETVELMDDDDERAPEPQRTEKRLLS